MAELTETELLERHEHEHLRDLPEHVAVYDIDGPLFFGAADKAISALHHYQRNVKVIVLDMTDVPEFDSLIKTLQQDGIMVVIANLSGRIMQKLERAGLNPVPGRLVYCRNMDEVRSAIQAPATSG